MLRDRVKRTPPEVWNKVKANLADMCAKGRHTPITGMLVGSKAPRAILTEKEVQLIRQSTASQETLARQYGVAQTTISAILRRETWRHIP